MIKSLLSLAVSIALTAIVALALLSFQARSAAAEGSCNTLATNYNNCCSECGPSDPPPSDPPPPPEENPPPRVTGADSSGASIKGVADQRFNQMITNQVLGSVLLGVNEQVNCHDCVSAFGSVGSFTAGVHGRKELTNNLSLLAGLAYTQYSENGYHVTSAPIGALALRYDFTDWGSSRPFFDVGTIFSPFQRVNYTRSYVTNLGPVSLTSSTNSADYAVYGRAGWISRFSPRDEVAGSVELWQLWQRVSGYADPASAFNPFDATVNTGTDRTNLVKLGGQWTHLFGSSVEGNVNGFFVQSFANHSGIVAAVTGNGNVTPTIGNQDWFEYGGRLGFRLHDGWIADLFVNGTLGPQPVGNTVHGGVGLRINY
ncbi:MAG: hypothetical protein JOY90_10040 [Bradyrhizobium sp.]|uniref:hypothetical protein n=1 Tax=Bradyrhizobium sp. TaxID=376 RepID=UPI001D1CA35E|nr:hypothetical protein [Bradyrhizobium sp.]MBV9560780.1 hypothetical protein [Bradyrhizobium sp.]